MPSPLRAAAIYGHAKAVQLLVEEGADVNAKASPDRATALSTAVFFGHTETVKLLIEYGADIEAKNDQGSTAMDSLKVDWETTQFIVQLLQIRVDRQVVEQGRAKVAELLRQ